MNQQQVTQAAKAELSSQIAYMRARASNFELMSLFKTSGLAKSCAEFWADNISAINFVLHNPEGVPVDASEAHPVARILRDAKFRDQLRSTEISLRFFGTGLMRKIRNPFGRTVDLRWVNPTLYHRDENAVEGYLRGFFIYSGRGQRNPNGYLNIADAVYLTEFSFDDQWDGVSSAQVAAQAAATEPEMQTTLLAFFQNMAIPMSIVQPEKDAMMATNKQELPSLIRFLQNRFQGAVNFGRTLVTAARWEWKQMQVNFKDLDMASMRRDLREDVAIAFRVEPAFILSGQSQYNELEGKISIWLDRYFRPRADWYARLLTQYLCDEEGYAGYRIVADISDLVREDESARLEVVSKKVATTLMTLGQAQRYLGYPPDPALENIYMVAGIPVPRDIIGTYWEYLLFRGRKPEEGQDGQDPSGGGGVDNTEGFQPNMRVDSPSELSDKILAGVSGENFNPKPSTPAEARSAGSAWQDLPELPADVYAEMKVAATKSLKGQAFETRLLSREMWGYIDGMMGALDYPEATKDAREAMKGQVIKAAKYHWHRLQQAQKSIQSTRLEYELEVESLFERAIAGELPPAQFRERIEAATSQIIEDAYYDGLMQGGVNSQELDEDEQQWLDGFKAAQVQWYDKAAQNIRDGKYSPDYIAQRAAEWFNKSVYPAYSEGIYSASKNMALMWVQGETEEGCISCGRLNGQVRRAKSWKKQNIRPKASDLGCKGFNCKCLFVPTEEPVNRGAYPNWRGFQIKSGSEVMAELEAEKVVQFSFGATTKSEDYTPTAEMARNAERGLELRRKHGRGGTAVGVARARDISNRRGLSASTVRRMVSYFARHEVDKQGEGWGVDSAGYIAWLLWGGDAGRTWANKINDKLKAKE